MIDVIVLFAQCIAFLFVLSIVFVITYNIAVSLNLEISPDFILVWESIGDLVQVFLALTYITTVIHLFMTADVSLQ